MFADIPGYRDAVEREQSLRENAFIDIEEQICGVDITPLNLRQWSILAAIGNPFIKGGDFGAADAAMFLWAISPEYSPQKKKRDDFIKRIAKIDYAETIKAIAKYLDNAFFDAPRSGKGDSGSIATFTACVIHRLASTYGWSENQILAIPLKRVWQYLRLIKRDDSPGSCFGNPSDEIRAEWLRKVNDGEIKLEDYVIGRDSSTTGA